MFRHCLVRTAICFALLSFCLSTVARAQGSDDIQELKQKASDLMKQTRYTEALPILEKIVAADPDDAQMQFYLGFALTGQAKNTRDEAARKSLRVRARAAFVRSKQLGVKEPVVDALIQSIPADGSDSPDGRAFSENAEANRLMNEAEAFFTQGKLDEALADYQKALQLDPKLYYAALFSGDVYMQRNDFAQAEVWYQKAIQIDPNRETAYRYSATPLMKQHKYDEARDRYVEAFISEPYNKFSVAGLTQWAQVTHATLAQPAITIPTRVTFDEKGEPKIDLDASVLLGGKDDGSFGWLAYGTTRTEWHKEKFAQTFPREKAYRHSLAEEADALRAVLTLATSDKKVKNLNPSLAKLKKLDDEGLLEAYILLARADQGIAEDYPAYLAQNRDKLRRYVVEYILTGGGDTKKF
jgi:tetratricopeptide (TPR) repeat protein